AVGHTVALADSSANVIKTDLYEAFGGIVSSSGESNNNRLANTKERDASIGLDNHGFRYYDPKHGRYINRDPIGYLDGMNVYLYISNNPINHIDPLGLDKITDNKKVQEAFEEAWVKSVPQITKGGITDEQIKTTHEEGGWIVRDSTTGEVLPYPTKPGKPRDPKHPADVLTLPRNDKDDGGGWWEGAGGKKYVDEDFRYEILAGYHTHPNESNAYGASPSPRDMQLSDNDTKVPEYIIDAAGVHKYDPSKTDNKKTKQDDGVTQEEKKEITEARNKAAIEAQKKDQD
ncbi:MAG: RHS repeat-associated core domain-containing protein, partial [Planctomycetes bacterium]|nr:RHS repeat-associated core domain-containing protein [Planctomycetota bacterium]